MSSLPLLRTLPRLAIFFVALAAAPAMADFALYRSLTLSRFNDVIDRGEEELKADPSRADATIPPLCYAYHKARRYDKIVWCAAVLDQRIAAGRKMHRDGLIMGSDMSPFPGMLRASMYLDFGQHDKALREGEAALALVKDENWGGGMMAPLRYRLDLFPTVALAAALSGKRDKAKATLKQIEDISLGFMGGLMKDHKNAAISRVNMALGNCSKVIEIAMSGEQHGFLRGVTDVLLGSGADSMKSQFDLSQSLMSAKCLVMTDKRKEAKVALDYIVSNPRAPEQGDLYWLALYERGRLSETESKAAEAIEDYRRAVEVIEQQRSTINAEASKIGFVGDKQSVYGQLIRLLVQQGRVGEAFDYVERSKSRALVDMLATKRDFSMSGTDPDKTRQILAQLDAADLASRNASNTATSAEISSARNLKLAHQTFSQAAPELSTLVSVSSVPSDELKNLLLENETLVEYYYQDKELYAFVLDKTQLQALKLDATGLIGQVQQLRSELEQVGTAAWESSAKALHALLWQPVEPLIKSKNVAVVAHGALHYLPFAVLMRPNGQLLIDSHELRFLPSASVLKFLQPVPARKDSPILVLGNPDLGDAKLDLQFAESEARLIAGMSKTSRLLVRLDASESNFKKAAGVFSKVHFATHGKFLADDPLSSGLYLAKDADNDGVLTVGELYSMRLDADLVTLSACETGLGKVASGDDVVGLTRGFLYAGSRSIVASLWSVDDKATATLMQAFYVNLATMNKREALRQAQLMTRKAFPHPFYWAAFQLTGRAE